MDLGGQDELAPSAPQPPPQEIPAAPAPKPKPKKGNDSLPIYELYFIIIIFNTVDSR